MYRAFAAAALTSLLLPALAHAQTAPPSAEPAEPSECTTTTTVRCTGAAAPLALPPENSAPPSYAQPPAYPPPQANPYPYPPPQAYQPSAYAYPPPCPIPPLGDLAHGRLVIDPDGSLWREKEVKRGTPGLWAPGLALWLGTYFATVVGGLYGKDFEWAPSSFPIFGAFGSAYIAGADGHGSAAALYAFSGLTQAAGFVMFVAGAVSGKPKLARTRVYMSAVPLQGGGGLGLSGRF